MPETIPYGVAPLAFFSSVYLPKVTPPKCAALTRTFALWTPATPELWCVEGPRCRLRMAAQ
jgi:hypothetical protein